MVIVSLDRLDSTSALAKMIIRGKGPPVGVRTLKKRGSLLPGYHCRGIQYIFTPRFQTKRRKHGRLAVPIGDEDNLFGNKLATSTLSRWLRHHTSGQDFCVLRVYSVFSSRKQDGLYRQPDAMHSNYTSLPILSSLTPRWHRHQWGPCRDAMLV